MEFKVEVEIGWIEEDDAGYSIDEIVKKEVVDAVAKQIVHHSKEAISEIVKEQTQTAQKQIEGEISKIVSDFIEQPVVQTDRYGDTIKQFASVREMTKATFDNYLNQVVNVKDGKIVENSYGAAKMTRYEALFKTHVFDLLDEKLKTAAENMEIKVKEGLEKIEAGMRNTVKSAVENQMGQRMGKLLEIDNLLPAPQEKGGKP